MDLNMNTLQIGIIIAIVILLAIILYITFSKKTPERYFRKAELADKNAIKYYDLGDTDLAEEYREEAEHYRKKAEELTHAMV